MKQASEYRKLKLYGKLIVSVLIISVITLLFYNNKITNKNTALAKVSKTTKPSSSVLNLPILNYPPSALMIQNTALNKDNSAIPPKELNQRLMDDTTEKSINNPNVSNSIKPTLSKSSTASKQPTTDLEERKTKPKTEIKKQIYQKLPVIKSKKVVYLTFDDGPQVISSQILNLLKKYNAKATFFMLDPNIKRYPSAVKQMVRDGDSIGSHGVTHNIHKVYRSPDSFVNEMKQTEETIKKVTGKETHLIRAPYGSVPYMKPAFRKASDTAGFIMWDWDIDSDDWQTTHGEFVQSIKKQVEACSGNRPLVILMHEKSTTVKYLETVLQYFQKLGYKMEAITENLHPVQFEYR